MPYLVYKIPNTVNSMIYVGVTHQTLELRFTSHWCSARKKAYSPLYKDMVKYGIDKFSIELLEKCGDQETMLKREAYWIRELNTMHPNGYNLKGRRVTDEQAAIIRFGAPGWKNAQLAQAFGISMSSLMLAKADSRANPYRDITEDDLPEDIEAYMQQYK